MRVLFILAALLLTTGGPSMADDSKRGRLASVGAQGQAAMTAPVSASEQHMNMLFERMTRGEITMGEALRIHREKFHGGQMPDYNSIQQNRQQQDNMMRRPDAQSPF